MLADLSFRPIHFVPGDTERPMSDTESDGPARRWGSSTARSCGEMVPSARLGFIDERLASLLGIPAADHDSLDEYWLESRASLRCGACEVRVSQVEIHGLNRADVEYRYLHPRGALWFRHLVRVFERDATGKPVPDGIIQDVTERRQPKRPFTN